MFFQRRFSSRCVGLQMNHFMSHDFILRFDFLSGDYCIKWNLMKLITASPVQAILDSNSTTAKEAISEFEY
jgi:hypothetical protein